MSTTPLGPGDMVMGKYRVERVLGSGAMGLVLEVMNVDLGQRFAVKMMHDGKMSPEHRERFLREARTAARLRSQHAVKVLDVGTTETGAPYMLMEHLDGRDLAAELEACGVLPVEDAVEYVLQTCEAIAEAHAAGVVHRDIKPANLFLVRGPGGAPTVKVLDFGISKVADSVALTGEARLLGSPLYMSPEQMRSSASVDARTDIWALGITLYELLAGRPPFDGQEIQEVFTRVALDDPPPLAPLRPDLPAGLEAAIVGGCLQKDPTRRFANVARLADALVPFGPKRADAHAERVAAVLGEQIVASRPTTALPVMPGDMTASARTALLLGTKVTGTGAAVVQATQTLPGPAPVRRRGVVAAVVALAVAGVAAVGVLGGRGRGQPPPAGTVATQPGPAASSAETPPERPLAQDPPGLDVPVVSPTAEPIPTASLSATVTAPIPKPKGTQPARLPPKPTTATHAPPASESPNFYNRGTKR